MPIPPIALQSHPLWAIRLRVPTPLGPVVRSVPGLDGRPMHLHGPSAEHVLSNARMLGAYGDIYAVRL